MCDEADLPFPSFDFDEFTSSPQFSMPLGGSMQGVYNREIQEGILHQNALHLQQQVAAFSQLDLQEQAPVQMPSWAEYLVPAEVAPAPLTRGVKRPGSPHDDSDESAGKRQKNLERMRVNAANWRKRNKDRLSKLEEQVAALTKENASLRTQAVAGTGPASPRLGFVCEASGVGQENLFGEPNQQAIGDLFADDGMMGYPENDASASPIPQIQDPKSSLLAGLKMVLQTHTSVFTDYLKGVTRVVPPGAQSQFTKWIEQNEALMKMIHTSWA
jgi:hypothetical protein